MSGLICELVISLIKVTAIERWGAARDDFPRNHAGALWAVDRKLMGAMNNRLGWGAFTGSRVSSLFAMVRACKDSSGLREFGFGRCISLLPLV
jgi:hypothetical protein